MPFLSALLLVVAIALAVLAVCAVLTWVEKKNPPKQFDERQQIVRGQAYKWACVTGLCYFISIAILDLVLPSGVQADLFLVIMVGITLAIFVCECYCCFHDAYLPLTKSPKANIIMLYALGAMYLLQAVNWVDRMTVTFAEDGFRIVKFGEVMLSITGDSAIVWGFLMVAVMSVTIATIELVRHIYGVSHEQE